MARSVEVSVPDWLLQYLVAGLAVFVVLWGGLSLYSAATGGFDVSGKPWLYAAFAGVWVALTVLWVRRARRWDSGGDVWEAIPSEQYAGRFAEAGGLARARWERALGRDDDERP